MQTLLAEAHILKPLITKEDQEILKLLTSDKTREVGYKALLEKYQERVYWQVRKLVGSHEDAADVTQEVWTKVIRYINGFKAEAGLYTWLYRIAHNESMTYIKRSKMSATSEIEKDVESGEESMMGSEAIWNVLQDAIAILPEKQRIVFELRYFEEMPYQSMSETLGTSVGALKASYHLALKKVEAHVKTICWS